MISYELADLARDAGRGGQVRVDASSWAIWSGPAAATPVVFSVSGALAFIIAIVCMQAKLGQVPFDQAEAECEIMSGVYVEYSGPPLAVHLMTRAMLLAIMPLLHHHRVLGRVER
jgi:formate hydrogenlyase subunit 4